MLHFERFGTGKLLVCLHGWGMNSELEKADFEPFFAGRGGWERLYLDLPGMGRSRADERIRNLDDLLSVVLEVLDECTAGRPYALSGTSAGAYLARGVAAQRREQVMGLMLRVPKVNSGGVPHQLPPFKPLIQDAAFMASLSAADQAALKGAIVQRPEYAQALLHKHKTLIEPAEAMQDTAFLAALRNTPENYGFKQPPENQPFNKPTLIVTGRQDTVTGYRDAWTLLEHYPRATFAVLDWAAHEWPLQEAKQQQLFAALVNDWLDRVEEMWP